MTAPASLTAIAIDVVGHYGRTAKNIVATYRAGTERAVSALSGRYQRLFKGQSLPWIGGDAKASLVGSQQRLSHLVVDSVERLAERATNAVDRVSGRTVQGLEAFGKQTAWADEMMVVGVMRKVNLPVARLSLQIADRIDDASRRLSQRVSGKPVAKAAKTVRTAKAGVKRARRAVRTAA